MTASALVQQLHLTPHPEGGFYREVYRSAGLISADALPPAFGSERPYATSIYYLLERGDFSAFHRIKSDEGWHFYAGGTLLIHCLDETGGYNCLRLGSHLAKGDLFQQSVPAGVWFASEPAPETEFALVGCTVAPGFDFRDFELAKKEDLLRSFPRHGDLITRLCRL